MKEKRRHKRVRAQGVAAYLRVDDMAASAIIENLSGGGMFIRTARPLARGTPVALDLIRPGLKRSISLFGKVVSRVEQDTAAQMRSAPGMGIAFDPLPKGEQDRFGKLLEGMGAPAAPMDEGGDFIPQPPAPFLPPRATTAAHGVPVSAPPVAVGLEIPDPVAVPPEGVARTDRPGSYSFTSTGPGEDQIPGDPKTVVNVELEVPRAGASASVMQEKLLNHIRGLLAQLAEAEDKIAVQSRQLAQAREDNVHMRGLLQERDRQIRVLLGGKSS